MKSVISKNPGYEQICKIGDILNGNTTINLHELPLTANQLASFKYAPVTSCDVERSFSRYKSIFRDNRRSFKFENLCHVTVVNCNSSLILGSESEASSSSQ